MATWPSWAHGRCPFATSSGTPIVSARRLAVRPGITGWAQINGRNAIGWDARLELDAWYVDHRSLALDVRILARTIPVVVRRSGISGAGHATMAQLPARRE